MILVLIPARAGSKGLPGKNLAEVGGVPLVGRAALTGRRALSLLGEEGRVVCSTDDQAIAQAAREWGAEVPFMRPSELATDTTSTLDAVLHAVNTLGLERASIVLLQPTSPLTEPKDVIAALRQHREKGTSVVTVCESHHPLEWSWSIGPAGELRPVFGEGAWPTRRQEAKAHVRPNGAVYVADVTHLKNGGSFLDAPLHGVKMPRDRSVDIDTELDLLVARSVLASRSDRVVQIGDRPVGPGHPCFVIAEAGVNHDGDLGMALELVDVAAEAGADAVKFQTFTAERLVTKKAPKANYQLETTDPAESQFQMLKDLELSPEGFEAIARRCQDRGVVFLSTPFDEESADLLEDLDVTAFKISSGDLTNLPFLAHVARKGRPMILSTGMGSLHEVAEAVGTIWENALEQLILLQCVSNYPADPAVVNLNAMATLRECFGVPAGFSDHTTGDDVALGAVALGAAVVEKHFTLDRNRPGPDHRASIEPTELARLVRGIRRVEASLGDGRKQPADSERATAMVARKSVVALRRIDSGEELTRANVGVRRPEGGLPPADLEKVLGCRARRMIEEGELIRMEMVE